MDFLGADDESTSAVRPSASAAKPAKEEKEEETTTVRPTATKDEDGEDPTTTAVSTARKEVDKDEDEEEDKPTVKPASPTVATAASGAAESEGLGDTIDACSDELSGDKCRALRQKNEVAIICSVLGGLIIIGFVIWYWRHRKRRAEKEGVEKGRLSMMTTRSVV